MLGSAGTFEASAQIGPIITVPEALAPTTTTTVPPRPGEPPPPTTTTTLPSLLQVLQPTTTTKPPPPPSSAPPAASIPVPGNGGGDGGIPAGVGPFPADLARQSASIKRSRARNTSPLMDGLHALLALGVPQEEALRAVFGRFPVAGQANYSHDWWFPRYGPGWRLHQGTDIFAVNGTPVHSPTDGVVKLASGGLGGIAVYVVQPDGTYFYLAHLNNTRAGLRDGDTVRTGDVVGTVGSTGNAAGGSPHLHFEVHPAPVKIITKGRGKNRTVTVIPLKVRPGTVLPAVDPKAYLDRSLQDAIDALPGVVATFEASRALPPPVAAPSPSLLAAGGLPTELASLAAAAPPAENLARVPLVALAFVLILMVSVLTPVLLPRRAMAGQGSPPEGPGPAKAARGRKRGGNAGKGPAGPPAPTPPAPAGPGARAGQAPGAPPAKARRLGRRPGKPGVTG